MSFGVIPMTRQNGYIYIYIYIYIILFCGKIERPSIQLNSIQKLNWREMRCKLVEKILKIYSRIWCCGEKIKSRSKSENLKLKLMPLLLGMN